MSVLDHIRFQDNGLIPAVIVDDVSGAVLTLCYMNREAVETTLATGEVHVYRRSKGRMMKKGGSSGHTQSVKKIFIDCAGSSLLIRIDQKVAACHAGYFTCYFTRYDPETDTTETVGKKVFEPKDVYGPDV
jgi:phosphoribosyl-AMP cyclohydrolase